MQAADSYFRHSRLHVARGSHLQLSAVHEYLLLWGARCVVQTLGDEIHDEAKKDDANHAANDSTDDFWRVVASALGVAGVLITALLLDAGPAGSGSLGALLFLPGSSDVSGTCIAGFLP